MTIARFALKRASRAPLNLLLTCALPLLAALLPSVEGWVLPMGFQMYGAVLLFAAYLLLRSVVEDGTSGILERIAAAPVSELRYLGETLLAYALVLVVMNAAVVGLGLVLHPGKLASPLLLFAAYSVFSLAALALALAGGALLRGSEAAYHGFSVVLMVAALLGGLFWPLEIEPPAMRRIAPLSPCYWLVDAMGAIQAGAAGAGPEAGRFVLDLAVMLLFTVAFLLVGSRRRMT